VFRLIICIRSSSYLNFVVICSLYLFHLLVPTVRSRRTHFEAVCTPNFSVGNVVLLEILDSHGDKDNVDSDLLSYDAV
jgi:hypothetical protein